jgi:DNA-binding transcriptional regulator YhcF (GntR family)
MSTGPLLTLDLDLRRPAGRQLEEQLRALIRRGALPVGAELPSTRALAADLGVSRGVAVRAYAQLAAEGYVALRRGAVPVVVAAPREPPQWDELEEDVAVALARYNLRPDLPDLALFPRNEWLAATRAALARAANHDLAYGEPWGAAALRHQLAAFLSRTRGVIATPYRTGVFAGSSHALHTICTVLRTHVGARRIAIEDPGHRWRTRAVAASGLEVVPVPVDADGLRVDALDGIDAVVVSPDHHFPTGAVPSPPGPPAAGSSSSTTTTRTSATTEPQPAPSKHLPQTTSRTSEAQARSLLRRCASAGQSSRHGSSSQPRTTSSRPRSRSRGSHSTRSPNSSPAATSTATSDAQGPPTAAAANFSFVSCPKPPALSPACSSPCRCPTTMTSPSSSPPHAAGASHSMALASTRSPPAGAASRSASQPLPNPHSAAP